MESNNDQGKSNIPTEDNIDMNNSEVDKAVIQNGEYADKSTVDSEVDEDSEEVSKVDAKEHSGKVKSYKKSINASSFDESADTSESSSGDITINDEVVMEVVQQFQVGLKRADEKKAITDSVDDVANFISEYEAKYGTDHPVFHQGTYQQAEQDSRRNLKFLLAYLHCDDHVNCELFCRTVMTSTYFQEVVRENVIFWGCSTSKLEGIKTCQALGQNKCPFLALLVSKRNKMNIVRLMEIKADPKVIVSMIQSGIVNGEKYLIAEREKRSEIVMTRNLKLRQDESFIRSLQADQEKDRKQLEAMEKLKELELEKQMKIDEEKQRIEEGIQRIKEQKAIAAMNLKSEPALDDPNAVRTLIKLPNGSRLERRFYNTDSLKHLYQFVFSHPESPDTFNICTNFPIRNLPCEPTPDCSEPPSFIEAQIGPREVLFVQELE